MDLTLLRGILTEEITYFAPLDWCRTDYLYRFLCRLFSGAFNNDCWKHHTSFSFQIEQWNKEGAVAKEAAAYISQYR